MQQSIVKFYIALSYRHCSTYFGHYHAHYQEPSNCRCSLCFPYECGGGRVFSLGRFVNKCPKHVEQCLYDKAIKFYDWLLHLFGCFFLSDWRCTEPQTLKMIMIVQSILPDTCGRMYIKNDYITSIYKYLMRQTQIFDVLLIW
jgi:hypothetical protein